MKKIKPIHNNIIVAQMEEEQNVGGIIISSNAKKRNEGKVVAISPDVEGMVSVGDIVGYPAFAGDLVESTDTKENRIIMDIHDILYIRK